MVSDGRPPNLRSTTCVTIRQRGEGVRKWPKSCRLSFMDGPNSKYWGTVEGTLIESAWFDLLDQSVLCLTVISFEGSFKACHKKLNGNDRFRLLRRFLGSRCSNVCLNLTSESRGWVLGGENCVEVWKAEATGGELRGVHSPLNFDYYVLLFV